MDYTQFKPKKNNEYNKAPCGDHHNLKEWEEYSRALAQMGEKFQQEAVLIPPEFRDFYKVLHQAAETGKYPPNNWLDEDGYNTDKKSMYGSIFRHVAEAYQGVKVDKESGLDPRLHAAVRLMMDYTRSKRGIKNSRDED